MKVVQRVFGETLLSDMVELISSFLILIVTLFPYIDLMLVNFRDGLEIFRFDQDK